ncbi:hypothetical protein Dsin_009100 [Dipteronia sinensis]|uniref:RNase H type-1 domain-containing protein n=1 Tax=Dipteronia sinensis TaxID=43782 RepID=A0AAE0AQU5_9ROSI|nr:hypothetical protein Dsin_009100 [Dipteronia sinensis]
MRLSWKTASFGISKNLVPSRFEVDIALASDCVNVLHKKRYGEGTVKNLRRVVHAFRVYGSILGQLVNWSKSSIFFGSSISPARISSLQSLVGMQIGRLPFSYLRVPLFQGKPYKSVLMPIADKILSKFAKWKDLALLNDSLLRKLTWKFITSNNFAFTFLHERYIRQLQKPHGGYITSSICNSFRTNYVKLIEDDIWLIGENSQRDFWHDNWLGVNILDLIGIPDFLAMHLHARVSDFIRDGRWILDDRFRARFPDLCFRIGRIVISPVTDYLVWPHSRECSVSCNTAYSRMFHDIPQLFGMWFSPYFGGMSPLTLGVLFSGRLCYLVCSSSLAALHSSDLTYGVPGFSHMEFQVSHIFREGNQVTDALSKHALGLSSDSSWSSTPSFCSSLVGLNSTESWWKLFWRLHLLSIVNLFIWKVYNNWIPLRVNLASHGLNSTESWWKLFWRLHLLSIVNLFIWKVYNNWIPLRVNLASHGMHLEVLCPICLEKGRRCCTLCEDVPLCGICIQFAILLVEERFRFHFPFGLCVLWWCVWQRRNYAIRGKVVSSASDIWDWAGGSLHDFLESTKSGLQSQSAVLESDALNVVNAISAKKVSGTEVGVVIHDILCLLREVIVFLIVYVPRLANKVANYLAKLALEHIGKLFRTRVSREKTLAFSSSSFNFPFSEKLNLEYVNMSSPGGNNIEQLFDGDVILTLAILAVSAVLAVSLLVLEVELNPTGGTVDSPPTSPVRLPASSDLDTGVGIFAGSGKTPVGVSGSPAPPHPISARSLEAFTARVGRYRDTPHRVQDTSPIEPVHVAVAVDADASAYSASPVVATGRSNPGATTELERSKEELAKAARGTEALNQSLKTAKKEADEAKADRERMQRALDTKILRSLHHPNLKASEAGVARAEGWVSAPSDPPSKFVKEAALTKEVGGNSDQTAAGEPRDDLSQVELLVVVGTQEAGGVPSGTEEG